MENGELVLEAVARELEEETGLRLTESNFLFFQDSLPLEPGRMHFVKLYLECRAVGDIWLSSESSEHAFITPADLKDYRIVFRND